MREVRNKKGRRERWQMDRKANKGRRRRKDLRGDALGFALSGQMRRDQKKRNKAKKKYLLKVKSPGAQIRQEETMS